MSSASPQALERPDPAQPRRTTSQRLARLVVAVLTVAAAVGGALAGCHPTGTGPLDVAYSAGFAALVTLAAGRSGRGSLLVLATIGVVLSRSWLWIPAGAALALAFASTFHRRAHMRLSALIGALAVQVVLRWPPAGFHGFTAAAAAVAVLPVLISGWRHSRSRLRRRLAIAVASLGGLALVLIVPVAVSALLSYHRASTGISLARQSLKQVEGGQTQVATAQLDQAAGDLATARRRLTGWWNAGGFLVPGVAQQERGLRDGAAIADRLMAVARRQAPALDLQALRYQGGRIDLQALQSLQAPAQRLDTAIIAAQSQLAHRAWPWLLPPLTRRLASFNTDLAKARNDDELAILATRTVPAILGGDGVRHYFVAFMTPAETRGLGGFIGAYGVLTVDHGSIHLTTAGRATDLVAGSTPTLTAPADYVARYGLFQPQQHFEDLTYSPDFPSVEQAIAGLYPQVGGVPIDGAMVLDPYALAALLHFTGPISIPGLAEQLTYRNAADVLLRQQYLTAGAGTVQRHDVLQDALRVGFGRLTSGSLPSPKTISSVLGPEVRQGRLLFWTSHPSDQPLLDRLALDGALPRPGPSSDFLAVTLANAANSKIDAYLHQHISDAVRYDPATGRVDATVTIQERNDAPSSGLPDYVIGSYRGSGLPPGTNYSWMSLYTPLQIVSAQVDGSPVSFSPGIPEDGSTAYSTYLTIPARSRSTLTVELQGSLPAGARYAMTIRQQPLANPQSFSMTVVPTPGWRYQTQSSPQWTASADQVEHHFWRFAK